MEQTEINRLREICEKEGFTINEFGDGLGQFFQITIKDEWEGVEFVECLNDCPGHFTKKKIYVVKEITNFNIMISIDDHGSNWNGWSKSFFKPSTEQAYKDQLIQEAKERFGDIRTNTKFDVSCFNGFKKTDFIYIPSSNIDWEYDKANDILYLHGFRLYQKGKWATKIEKPEIKVEYTGWEYQQIMDNAVSIGFKVPNSFVMSVRLGELMAEFIKNHIENEKTS